MRRTSVLRLQSRLAGHRAVYCAHYSTAPDTAWQRDGFAFLPAQPGKEGQKARPLVLALGWLGANERHLSKYTGWYSNQGYDTLSFIPPATTMLLPQLGVENATRLLRYAVELSGKDEQRPILFHIFSNNGFYFYANVLRQVEQASQYERVLHSTVGCILDSTPSHLSVEVFTKGFGGALLGSMGITNQGKPTYHHWFISPIVRSLFALAFMPPFFRGNMSALLDAYTRFQPKCPQLFLYSKGDELIPYTDVEQAIRITKDMGIPLTEKCWPDSPHVGHFRTHSAEYRAAVTSFIREATERWHQNNNITPIWQHQATPDTAVEVADQWKRFILHF